MDNLENNNLENDNLENKKSKSKKSKSEKLKSKNPKSKKKTIITSIVMAIIFIIGTVIATASAMILSIAEDYEVYTVSEENNLNAFNKLLMDRYSIWVLANDIYSSDVQADKQAQYYISEINKTNLHLGVIKSDHKPTDEDFYVKYSDASLYEANNFDNSFEQRMKYGEVHVFETYVDESTTISYDMKSIAGYATVQQSWEYNQSLKVDSYYYNYMSDELYIGVGNLLIPYMLSVSVEKEDGIGTWYEDVDLKQLVNATEKAWRQDNHISMIILDVNNIRIPINSIKVIDDFDIQENSFEILYADVLSMGSGVANISISASRWEEVNQYITEENIAKKDEHSGKNGRYYCIVSYLNDPLIDNGENGLWNSDLFLQAKAWADLVYKYKNAAIVGIAISSIMVIIPLIYFTILLVKLFIWTLGKVKLIWRLMIVTVIATTLGGAFCAAVMNEGAVFVLWMLMCIVVVYPIVIYIGYQFKQLTIATEQLAEGNLGHKMNTGWMMWDMKKQAENLNRIGDSIAVAVDEQMKSERMKTELITNVSHDIKTPLTSIINYTYLLEKEDIQNEAAVGYIEVISRQSERLKNLIVDLIEASKASTGNLELQMEPCDVKLALQQVAGEYEDKLNAKNIQLILAVPEALNDELSDEAQSTMILADGRYLFRIFDNLLVNIMKYSTENTRAYINLSITEQNMVKVIFKNTSREPLTRTGEEFMERFYQGDISRNTDGNGLGLAIANSLAESMQGSMKVAIDGDLFKVILEFPVATE